jgi:hypothetical protein
MATLKQKLYDAEKEARLAQDLLKDEEWAHEKTKSKLEATRTALLENAQRSDADINALCDDIVAERERNKKLMRYNVISTLIVIAVVALLALALQATVLS